MSKPKSVILFSNNMVMVFDATGEQMPEYQGRHTTVAAALKCADLDECEFEYGEWGRSMKPITRDEFFNLSTKATDGAH